MTRKSFLAGAAALATDCAVPVPYVAEIPSLKVWFLGTGAADWSGRDDHGEDRRNSSVLLENRVLIDLTARNLEMLPTGCRPTTVFYTHSHGDHFAPETAVCLGIRRAYVHASWVEDARKDFGVAARRLGKSASDAHVPNGVPVTAIIMEATVGVDYADDFRLFTHSSVATVAQTVRVLSKSGRYRPRLGQKVYITHLARTLHGTQSEIAAVVPAPLTPAYDGLEVLF